LHIPNNLTDDNLLLDFIGIHYIDIVEVLVLTNHPTNGPVTQNLFKRIGKRNTPVSCKVITANINAFVFNATTKNNFVKF